MSFLSHPSRILLLLTTALAAAANQPCYWRSQSQIISEPSGWFACNNTAAQPGGAQLCCLNGAFCGEDSICHSTDSGGGSGWFVGGCTDGSYSDPVCRKSCTGDGQTWIEYNLTEQLWHCCGSSGCNGTPTAETFQAVAPEQWSAVPSLQTSSASAVAGDATVTATATATAMPKSNDTGLVAGVAVVAVIAGLALVACLAFLLLWRKAVNRRRSTEQDLLRQREQVDAQRQESKQQQSPYTETAYHETAVASPYPLYKPPVQASIPRGELGGDDGVGELAASRSP